MNTWTATQHRAYYLKHKRRLLFQANECAMYRRMASERRSIIQSKRSGLNIRATPP